MTMLIAGLIVRLWLTVISAISTEPILGYQSPLTDAIAQEGIDDFAALKDVSRHARTASVPSFACSNNGVVPAL